MIERCVMLVIPVNSNKFEVRFEKGNRKVAEFKTLKEAVDYAFELEKSRWENYKRSKK